MPGPRRERVAPSTDWAARRDHRHPDAGDQCRTVVLRRQIVVTDARLGVRSRRAQRHIAAAGRRQNDEISARFAKGAIHLLRFVLVRPPAPIIAEGHGSETEIGHAQT